MRKEVIFLFSLLFGHLASFSFYMGKVWPKHWPKARSRPAGRSSGQVWPGPLTSSGQLRPDLARPDRAWPDGAPTPHPLSNVEKTRCVLRGRSIPFQHWIGGGGFCNGESKNFAQAFRKRLGKLSGNFEKRFLLLKMQKQQA